MYTVDHGYQLRPGRHEAPQDGRCAMEWVSYLAGEDHSDQPACVSPVLRAYCISLNDDLEHDARQRLRPFLARTIGTTGDGEDARRGWLAMDWLVRVHTPAWLAVAGDDAGAQRLRALAPIEGPATLATARDALTIVRGGGSRRVLRANRWRRGPEAVARLVWGPTAAAAWAAIRIGLDDPMAVSVCAATRAVSTQAGAARLRSETGPLRGRAARAEAARVLAPTSGPLEQAGLDLLHRMLPTIAPDGSTTLGAAMTPVPA